VAAKAGTWCGARVLTGMMVAVALTSAAPAAAVPCPATAALEGPPRVTAPIASALKAHGVAIGTTASCPGRTVRAVLTPAAPARGYRLHIEDGFGRTSDRLIAEPGMAVSLIESWAVEEDADLLTVAPPPAPPAAAVTAAVTAAAPPVVMAASPFYLHGGVTSALGSDHSIWAGGGVAGCARLGAICVGGKARLMRDTRLGGQTADAGAFRTGADVLVTAGLPLAHGRLLLMPTVGIGAGWLRTFVSAEDVDSPAETANTFGLRGEASVLAGVALAKHVMVALDLGGTFSPGARPEPAMEQRFTSNLPGEPKATLLAALSCLWAP
jgi:hypothetical protein